MLFIADLEKWALFAETICILSYRLPAGNMVLSTFLGNIGM